MDETPTLSTPPDAPREPRRRADYGPHTWALLREAYLAGASAPHLSRTLGPNAHTIRKRACREGWTRRAYAAALDRPGAVRPAPPGPPPDPSAAANAAAPTPADPVRAAVARAAAQLAEGRGAEAAVTLKAAEALRRLQADLPTDPPPDRRDPEHELAVLERYRQEVEARADALARHLLLSDGPSQAPAVHSPFVLHWRALHLGPEAARRDRERATHAGWARGVYAPDGALRPLPDLLADERRRLWNGIVDPDDALPPPDTPDPLPPDPDTPPPAWTGPIVRAL